jgi:hypothetical protein
MWQDKDVAKETAIKKRRDRKKKGRKGGKGEGNGLREAAIRRNKGRGRMERKLKQEEENGEKLLKIYFRGIKRKEDCIIEGKSMEKYKIGEGESKNGKRGGAEKNKEKSITKRNKK